MKKTFFKRLIIFIVFQLFLSFFHLAGLENEFFVKEIKEKEIVFLEKNFLFPFKDRYSAQLFFAIATAYSSEYEQTDETPFLTAANTLTREGVVANNFLPFGTRIKFPEIFGEKIFVVEDRMHPRKSDSHFDIWFEDQKTASEFGVKITYVEILP